MTSSLRLITSPANMAAAGSDEGQRLGQKTVRGSPEMTGRLRTQSAAAAAAGDESNLQWTVMLVDDVEMSSLHRCVTEERGRNATNDHHLHTYHRYLPLSATRPGHPSRIG